MNTPNDCCDSCQNGFACECEDEPAHQEFDFSDPILTRPGESLIDTVVAARLADETDGEFELPTNDMKP